MTPQVEGLPNPIPRQQNVKNKILAKIFQFSRRTCKVFCPTNAHLQRHATKLVVLSFSFVKAPPGPKGCQLSQISKYQNTVPNIYLELYPANSWAELTVSPDNPSCLPHQTYHSIFITIYLTWCTYHLKWQKIYKYYVVTCSHNHCSHGNATKFIPSYCCYHGHSWQQSKMFQVCHENALLSSYKIQVRQK